MQLFDPFRYFSRYGYCLKSERRRQYAKNILKWRICTDFGKVSTSISRICFVIPNLMWTCDLRRIHPASTSHSGSVNRLQKGKLDRPIFVSAESP